VPVDPILIRFMTDPVVMATELLGGIVTVVVPVFEYVISLLSASAATKVSDVVVTALTVKLAMLFICAAVKTCPVTKVAMDLLVAQNVFI
jgi:hypothetical protein